MVSFLLDTYNSGVVDTPTDSFTGHSTPTEIGNNLHTVQAIVVVSCIICLAIIATVYIKVAYKKKKENDNSKSDK